MKKSKNMDEMINELARNVIVSRKSLGLNHIELAEKCGLTRPIISSIENATGNPTINTIAKLSNVLNVSTELLFISKLKYINLQNLLRSSYLKDDSNHFDFIITEKDWKFLIENSGNEEKTNSGKVAKTVSSIIRANLGEMNNTICLLATLGIIFQQDGFKYGLNFGAWLGAKLSC
jgi:transcriptional regulator with XRE-family HTH domain